MIVHSMPGVCIDILLEHNSFPGRCVSVLTLGRVMITCFYNGFTSRSLLSQAFPDIHEALHLMYVWKGVYRALLSGCS